MCQKCVHFNTIKAANKTACEYNVHDMCSISMCYMAFMYILVYISICRKKKCNTTKHRPASFHPRIQVGDRLSIILIITILISLFLFLFKYLQVEKKVVDEEFRLQGSACLRPAPPTTLARLAANDTKHLLYSGVPHNPYNTVFSTSRSIAQNHRSISDRVLLRTNLR
jgi:hypothetical protein